MGDGPLIRHRSCPQTTFTALEEVRPAHGVLAHVERAGAPRKGEDTKGSGKGRRGGF